jgi:hypothetical protein
MRAAARVQGPVRKELKIVSMLDKRLVSRFGRSVPSRINVDSERLGMCTGANERTKEGLMQRVLTCVLAIGCVGTSSLLFHARRAPASLDVQMATDGAFRDGLYLGALDRVAGRMVTPPIARWSSAQDRASFARGYRQGLKQRQRN